MKSFLICGLGNIGTEYELTRHNIGFLSVDYLAEKHNASFSSSRLADKAELKIKGRKLILIKPTTYMNLSGKAVRYWMQEENIDLENIMIITDDIALPFGRLRLRQKGSCAGHNGLKSVEELTGTQDYARLKMGIGNNFPKGGQVNYVLSRFDQNEFDRMPEILEKSGKMIESFCLAGISRTMTQFND